ncbi:MAG TPA: aldehyde dehydrogenase family protein, partial [Verrucomicrobiae bacterium]|nr:aldehyde dehydrogenase family protein [Verrucomicrobiae bacterium]
MITLEQRAALDRLANAIIPADERDAGAATVNAGAQIATRIFNGINSDLYRDGLARAEQIACERFRRTITELDLAQTRDLVEILREIENPFFKQLRMDVCATYLSDPGVWQRIGFPGPSVMSGGYSDFDQPQTSRVTQLKEPAFMTTPAVLPAVQSFLSKPARMLIGSEWRDSASGERIESFDPATGKVIGTVPAGGEEDANAAVKAAR